MRKRSQRKSKPTIDEPKHIVQKIKTEKKSIFVKKNWWIAISLVSIFILVLFLNSYFNIISEDTYNSEGEGLDKYYLSGPDPYYNMRIIDETLYGENSGQYQFYSSKDPLLNYPLGRSGARAPLFNMITIGFSRLLTPFMDEIDAVGYSMQFIPALFGALLVIPAYMIGKTLFGKKEGILAALLIALIYTVSLAVNDNLITSIFIYILNIVPVENSMVIKAFTLFFICSSAFIILFIDNEKKSNIQKAVTSNLFKCITSTSNF